MLAANTQWEGSSTGTRRKDDLNFLEKVQQGSTEVHSDRAKIAHNIGIV
jgi:hypothetical protein